VSASVLVVVIRNSCEECYFLKILLTIQSNLMLWLESIAGGELSGGGVAVAVF
jgi:hypothetical protein